MPPPTSPNAPERRTFAAAIFDMDGLLLDSERVILETWQEVAREHGAQLTREAYVQLIGRRGADVRELFRSMLPASFPFETARGHVQERVKARREREGFTVKPGARVLLERLRRARVPCAVASSTRLDEVERRLTLTKLREHFAACAGGDEVEHGKPAPDIFLLAARRLNIAADACLAFDDVEHGARAALAAGMQVVIVPDLKPASAEISALTWAVLPSLEEVHARIGDWFGAERPHERATESA